eukprot:m.284430 g.284430  ORF g.284430 m.284430 type:complete len:106 (-) comp54964_c1_seq55:433-750(-)
MRFECVLSVAVPPNPRQHGKTELIHILFFPLILLCFSVFTLYCISLCSLCFVFLCVHFFVSLCSLSLCFSLFLSLPFSSTFRSTQKDTDAAKHQCMKTQWTTNAI